jgi:hypothetical protein
MDVPGLQSKPEPGDAITGGTLNLTKTSAFGAAVVGLVTAINPLFESVFGEDASDWIKAAIIIAAIASWALIATADILGRGYASANQNLQIAPMPSAAIASKTVGGDVAGYSVVAVRLDPTKRDSAEFLITKTGKETEWIDGKDLDFSPPTATPMPTPPSTAPTTPTPPSTPPQSGGQP